MRKFAALAPLALAFLAGCTSNAAHRIDAQGRAVEVRIAPGELATPQGRAKAETSALEIHDDFELLFLEFDDQGHLFSRAPLELLIQTLLNEAANPNGERITLVLFAHGWQNDARLCNGNVCCFRAFLSRIAADSRITAERSGGVIKAPKVIGIFVGWRGLSATIPPFRGLSFYARKTAAHTIGNGELVEVLTFLDEYQKYVNANAAARCRLLIMGHSFGGAMVYSAVANVLKSRVVEARVRGALTGSNEPIEGFGDLIVLANPAFEASLYLPLYELMSRYESFSPDQQPIFVIVASETDSATRLFFKIGRWVSTMFQKTGPRSSRAALVTTVGNYDQFLTHRATAPDETRRREGGTLLGTVKDCECQLPISNLPLESVDRLVGLLAHVSPSPRQPKPPPTQACSGAERMGSIELRCVSPREVPLWVVRASDEVVSGHSGFFTRPVTDLIRGLIAEKVLKEEAAAPRHPAP